ncbi:MAG: hypothetical protein H6739_02610 [Alphaproteobacteria bacterium]|nr:hypothetical protein [Alphaproteobacteria bacterium]
MRGTLKVVLAGILGLSLACAGGKDEADDSNVTDDTGTSGDDTQESDPGDTSYGEVFDRQDPLFSVAFDAAGGTWTSSTGYWNNAFINASKSDGSRSETVIVEVDGNLRYADEYPVKLIRYAAGAAQAEIDTQYEVSNPAGVTFVVEGFADDTYLHGYLVGTATLTDTLGGGTASWTDMELTSWPKF